mmetsp:Transcript_4343/g.17067  ORF Transcript_4343/g.17067 Transcript_4343/m.17067 type:complete len:91 (+) Transcript_4343:812-1084(+)
METGPAASSTSRGNARGQEIPLRPPAAVLLLRPLVVGIPAEGHRRSCRPVLLHPEASAPASLLVLVLMLVLVLVLVLALGEAPPHTVSIA